MQSVVHYFFHLVFPAVLAWLLFRRQWKRAYWMLLATMLVDLDHLLATPIFQAHRCSIQFHPLHSYWAMAVYAGMLLLKPPYRIIAVGLLWHMATDLMDCVWSYGGCADCLKGAPAEGLLRWVWGLVRTAF